MPLLCIQSLTDDPRLLPYHNMRDAELAQRGDPSDPDPHPGLRGLFVAEGELVVRRLIHSVFPVASMLLANNRVEALRSEWQALPAGVPVFVAEQSVLNDIVGWNMHRGVLAMGVRPAQSPWEALLERDGPLVVLEDLVNHDNMGAIFRNVAGLGGPGAGVLLSPRCADPLYRKSLRVSMGQVLTVPFARVTGWPDSLATLVAAGWEVVAMTPGRGAIDLEGLASEPRLRRAILVGSEGPGLSSAALAAATRQVRIHMPPAPRPLGGSRVDEPIDSLNVAMATGLALHRLGPRATPEPGP